jgi:epoxide hydrolase-like predicted phosphatase
MIKAILFDYGGVYADSPFAAIDDLAREMDLDADLLKTITFGDLYQDGDHPWHKLEKGLITLEQAREGILLEGEKHALKTDIYEMFARFAGVDKTMCQPLIEKTLAWKSQGLKLAMVTNNLKEFSHWRDTFPYDVNEVYDVVFDSCLAGIRKPDPSVFKQVLTSLDIKPEEAVFLDDHQPNVDAALSVGILSFLVGDEIADAIQWVDTLIPS